MFDLIIKDGNIFDGTGTKPYIADIGIVNGKITKIGSISEKAKKIIDAKGLTVSPGFIDSHSHSDNAVFDFSEMREKCEQGITTSIAGQCGSSTVARCNSISETMSDFVKLVSKIPQGSNIATFVGHGTIRKAVMGYENREPTKDELEKMKNILKECVRNGALGISFGLIYNPGMFAKTDELIELAKTCAAEGGMLAAHMRNEGDALIEATEEFISVVKASGARGVISHHKTCFKRNHGKVLQTLKMIETANNDGCDIYCDVYPYTASSTGVGARFIPKEYQADGKTVENLKNPKTRKAIIEYNKKRGDVDHIDWALITRCKNHPEYDGKYICDIAKVMNVSDIEAALNLIEISDNSSQACFFSMREEDVETVIKFPRSMICTDSGVVTSSSPYHPRLRASFPRAIRRFVRELGSVTLSEMIRKMTSLPAYVYNLEGKGLLKEGYDADICIFNYEKIKDNADYINPHLRADGLNYVIVSGEIVANDSEYTGAKPGKLILRK